MHSNIKIIIVSFVVFSSNLFSMRGITLAENNIPEVKFSSSMQQEFHQDLSPQLKEFDDLSDFSIQFIGKTVTQKNIDAAMSKAFEIFGLKLRKKREQDRKQFELNDIADVANQEAAMKTILIESVKKYQHE